MMELVLSVSVGLIVLISFVFILNAVLKNVVVRLLSQIVSMVYRLICVKLLNLMSEMMVRVIYFIMLYQMLLVNV